MYTGTSANKYDHIFFTTLREQILYTSVILQSFKIGPLQETANQWFEFKFSLYYPKINGIQQIQLIKIPITAVN